MVQVRQYDLELANKLCLLTRDQVVARVCIATERDSIDGEQRDIVHTHIRLFSNSSPPGSELQITKLSYDGYDPLERSCGSMIPSWCYNPDFSIMERSDYPLMAEEVASWRNENRPWFINKPVMIYDAINRVELKGWTMSLLLHLAQIRAMIQEESYGMPQLRCRLDAIISQEIKRHASFAR